MDWLYLAIGAFTFFGVAIFNIGMETRRAQRLVNFMGYGGAKVFYGILGLALMILGLLGLIEV